MKTKLRVLFVAATVIVALTACFSPLGPLNIGELTVALSAPTSRGFSGDATPSVVASFRLTISATDMETVTATAAVGESALVVAVAAGTGRTVTLEALNSSGTVLYRGATTVNVQGGAQADVVIDMQKLFSEELQGAVLALSDNSNFLSDAPSEIDFQAVVGDQISALFDTADPMKLGVPVPWFVDASSLTLQFTVGTGSTLEHGGTTAADGIVTLDLTSSQQVNVVAPDNTSTPYTIEAVPSVDASSLISDISAAQALHDGADVGLNAGEYSSGSKATFLSAINAANGFFDTSFLSKDAADLTTATSALASARNAFESSQNGSVIVSASSVSTTEGGSTGTLSLSLGDSPIADVTVSAVAGTTDASLSVSAITFTSTNWNTPQEIILTATDDVAANGTRTGTVSFTASSADTRYDGAIIDDVTFTVIDNDSPAVSISATSLSATEAGAAPAYDLVLTSQPTANVTIDLTTSSGNASLSTSSVMFTSVNWATPQTVSVTAVNDQVDYGSGPRLETITHVVTSADTDYDGFTIPDVSVDVYDDDVAGVTVSTAAVSTTEGGGTQTFTVVLDSEPTGDVTVGLTSSLGATTISPLTLTFTNLDWSASQVVTVSAVDDAIANGTRSDSIQFAVTSGDTIYSGMSVAAVASTVTDNEASSISLTTTSLSATEAGAAPAYDLVLTSQPTANVTIDLTTASGNATLSTSTVIFTSVNWATPQTVTVTAVDDLVDYGSGPRLETITHVVTSADTDYDGFTVPDVSVDVFDDDIAGVTVSTAAVSITEGAGTQTFTVVLDSEPTADVTVGLASSLGATTISPSTLTFTNLDWSASQTITVSTMDDDTANGTRADSIQFAVTSGDTIYSGMSVAAVASTVTDNDVSSISLTTTSLSATEAGSAVSYDLVLASLPTDDVTIDVIAASGNATLSPSTVVFTPSDWDVWQTIMVTANDDSIDNPSNPRPETIVHTLASADPGYDGLSVDDVAVSVFNNDTAGITVSTSSVSIMEGGAGSSFTVELDSEPTNDVIIGVTSSSGESLVSSTSLTFTSSDWATPQMVTVTAPDDIMANGTRADSIVFNVTSSDTKYSGMVVPSVTSVINDNDVADVIIGATSIMADEYGPDVSYSVVLASAPMDDVTVTVSNSSGNVMSSPSTLTFTSGNWNTQQWVTVTAIADGMVTGTRPDTMMHIVSSASPAYNGIPVPDVSVMVQDFDFDLSWNTNDNFSPGPGDDVNAVLFGTPPTSGTYSNGSVVPIPAAADGPFLQGYKLTGWNTSPDGSGTNYAPGSSITMWANTTLYAQWAGGPGNFAAAFSGGDGSAGTPYEFSSAAELHNIGHRGLIDQGLFFKQTANIDLGVAPWNSGDGWPGIGMIGVTAFNPSIEGNGFVISNLTINRPGGTAGLITTADGATITGLGLENVSISTDEGFVGAIIGINNSLNDTSIVDSYATGTITVDDTMFGGPADADDVAVGGLIGHGIRTMITGSFSEVNVSSTGDRVGGIAGFTQEFGGGQPDIVDTSYSVGNVTGNDKVGGLVGEAQGAIQHSYAAGIVTGSSTVGGIVGLYSGTPAVLASYYDSTVTGQSDVGNGAPVASAGMVQQTTFQPGTNNWDFTTVWAINEGTSYPYHQWWTGAAPMP